MLWTVLVDTDNTDSFTLDFVTLFPVMYVFVFLNIFNLNVAASRFKYIAVFVNCGNIPYFLIPVCSCNRYKRSNSLGVYWHNKFWRNNTVVSEFFVTSINFTHTQSSPFSTVTAKLCWRPAATWTARSLKHRMCRGLLMVFSRMIFAVPTWQAPLSPQPKILPSLSSARQWAAPAATATIWTPSPMSTLVGVLWPAGPGLCFRCQIARCN